MKQPLWFMMMVLLLTHCSPTPVPTMPKVSPHTPISPAALTNMVLIPAGDFMMGGEERDEDEKPRHTVYVEAFYMDIYEVTNEEYALFLNAKGNQEEGEVAWLDVENDWVKIHQLNGDWQADEGYGRYPVMEVSWYGAQAYCAWQGKRLPTEAEWEKAARGTDGRIYPWGNEFDGRRLNFCDKHCEFGWANNDDDGYTNMAPVGSYPNGVSPYGVFDMAGNVWEWTLSDYKAYPYDENDGRNDIAKTTPRVLRGGSWHDSAPNVWSVGRYFYDPYTHSHSFGFRCSYRP